MLEAIGRKAFHLTVVKDGFALQGAYVHKDDGKTLDPFEFQLTRATKKVFVLTDSGRPAADVTVAFRSRKIAASPEHVIYGMSVPSVSFKADTTGKVELNYFAVADSIKLSVQSQSSTEPTVVEVTIDENPAQTVEIQARKKPAVAADSLLWTPPAVEVDDSQVEWIRKNAVPIRAAEGRIDSDDFADLQPLKKLIGDCRIVQLGEQSHGDGTCFQTKVRLIEFLHREMGFDILAFESGLYDCDRANAAFSQVLKPIEAAQQGVFGIWTGSSQVAPLWDYIAATRKTSRPLELTGFDCQMTGQASRDHLVGDMKALVEKYPVPNATNPNDPPWRQFFEGSEQLTSGQQFTNSKDDWMSSLDSLITAIDNTKAAAGEEEGRKNFWRQQLRSLKAFASYTINPSPTPGISQVAQQVNPRDAQMAENLIWLANQRSPDRKIIVWAASFHILRNAADIEVPDKSVDYSTIVPMGHHVHQKLGKSVYTIGFTAQEGQAGLWFRPGFPISKAPSGTLEDLCARADLEQALVPLRDLPKEAAWLNEKITARPLGYSWIRARWSNHFDALLF